jgi:hypothetical protein
METLFLICNNNNRNIEILSNNTDKNIFNENTENSKRLLSILSESKK